MPERYDVIIVGGGAAGLSAANELIRSDRKVLLLDARERLGGRIHTLHLPELAVPVELGAEFVHGRVEETLGLAAAAGALVDRLPDDHLWKSGEQFVSLDDFWEKLEAFFKKLPTRGRDQSFATTIRRRKLDSNIRRLALSFVEGFHAADLERVSTHAVASSGEGSNDQFRIISGQDSLIRFLHASLRNTDCDIRLRRRVERVQWKRGSVQIEATALHDRETYSASQIIIAVPLGVLQAAPGDEGAIEFTPELSQKKSPLSHLAMGHVARIVFRFRESFWNESDFLQKRMTSGNAPPELVFMHDADADVPTWWSPAPAQLPLLTAWAGGPKAERLLMLDESARADAAVRSLAKTLHLPLRRVARQVEQWWTYDWRGDPYSRGAYSYTLVDGANAAKDLSRPLEQTLFFAGEATSAEQSGTVAGAIESGRRAAREIMKGRS